MSSIRLMKPCTIEWSADPSANLRRLSALRYPLLGTPKLDGIRAATPGGRPQSNSGKPFPNPLVMRALRDYPDLDGELCLGDPAGADVFNRTTSTVMSQSAAISDLAYYIFDTMNDPRPYASRIGFAPLPTDAPFLQILPQTTLENPEQVLFYLEQVLAAGYEGVILRDPAGRYKNGRSTLREGGMLRIKPRIDEEARIVSFDALQVNQNDPYASELGYTRRSTAKAGKVEIETMGAMNLVSKRWPKGFSIGTGFTEAQRTDFWRRRSELVGSIVKFSYQAHGSIDRPRQPVFIGFRAAIDLDEEV